MVEICYMNIDSFIIHVKTDDICKGIAKDVKTRFNTSNIETDRSLSKEKMKKYLC